MAADHDVTSARPGSDFPRPGPDTEAEPGERRSNAPAKAPADQRTGSHTGMIGGGGAEAVAPTKNGRKRTTKKYQG
jgi:hypothetical protein